MVEPTAKLKEMYIEDVVNNDRQNNPADQTNIDNGRTGDDQSD